MFRGSRDVPLHILDRFHIAAKMNKALDEVRADETRRMQREGRDPVLKKSRWLLLKRSENLGDEQHFRLRDLLRYNLKTVRAYLLKEAFQQLWNYNSPAWAGKFLDECCRQTMRSRIEPMKKIARSLRQHRELILNNFRAGKLLSSGVVEGLNNKAKVTMRKSYGFRTYRVLELALYHSLGKIASMPWSYSCLFVFIRGQISSFLLSIEFGSLESIREKTTWPRINTNERE